MKVRCKMCVHESNGYCTKKKQDTKPVKIRLNKPRSCSLFSEDALWVFNDFKKRELHKKKLAAIALRNSAIAEAVVQVQNDLANRKQEGENNEV